MLNDYTTVLVTGGAGFIGHHLVHRLLELGKEVVVFDSLETGTRENVPPEATLITGNINDRDALIAALEGVDIVFHTAANANGSRSVQEPLFDFSVNAQGTAHVLEAAVAARVKRFVYTSSAAVYGAPVYSPMDEAHPHNIQIPYGASKYTGEILARTFMRTYNLPIVIGRPFCVYGSGENPKTSLVEPQRYLRWHLNHEPIRLVGDPDKKIRDFVHVSDLVEGLVTIAERGEAGEAYNIGSGTQISMRALIDVISAATGRTAEIHHIPHITDDTYELTTTIDKLRALGYEPKMAIENGMRQLAQELGEYPELPSGETIFHPNQSERSIE